MYSFSTASSVQAVGQAEAVPLGPLARHVGRQVLAGDELAVAEDDRALHGVAQLADVARPVVVLEHLHRLRVHAGHALARVAR